MRAASARPEMPRVKQVSSATEAERFACGFAVRIPGGAGRAFGVWGRLTLTLTPLTVLSITPSEMERNVAAGEDA